MRLSGAPLHRPHAAGPSMATWLPPRLSPCESCESRRCEHSVQCISARPYGRCFRRVPRNGIAGAGGWNFSLFSTATTPLYIPPIGARGSLFSTSSPHLLVLALLAVAVLTRVGWCLAHLGCFSLVTSDEEHFSRACWPFVHLLIRVLGPLSCRIVVLLSFRGSLCIQDPHPLSDT